MTHTAAPWRYNTDNNSIESHSEWVIKPEYDDEEGVRTQVISTFAAMGGNDTKADIKLICAAPEMLEVIGRILMQYDESRGGISARLSQEYIDELNRVFDLATP